MLKVYLVTLKICNEKKNLILSKVKSEEWKDTFILLHVSSVLPRFNQIVTLKVKSVSFLKVLIMLSAISS